MHINMFDFLYNVISKIWHYFFTDCQKFSYLGANYWLSHYTTEDSSPNFFIIELEDSFKKVNAT